MYQMICLKKKKGYTEKSCLEKKQRKKGKSKDKKARKVHTQAPVWPSPLYPGTHSYRSSHRLPEGRKGYCRHIPSVVES